MVLKLPGGLFGAGGAISAEQPRSATIIVAKDGSGDSDDIEEGANMLPPGGGVVNIKEGTYVLTSAINITSNNVALFGAGNSSIIYTTSNITMINVDNADNVTIKDLHFSGNLAGAVQTGIYADTCVNLVVDRCIFENINLAPIKLWAAADGAKIINNTILICNGIGITIVGTNNIIAYNHVVSADSHGISISGTNDNTISNNIIYRAGGIGININASNHSIVSCNSVIEAGYGGTRTGIIVSSSDECVVCNNICRDCTNYGIWVTSGASDKNIIDGNVVTGNTTGQIQDAGTGTVVGDNVT